MAYRVCLIKLLIRRYFKFLLLSFFRQKESIAIRALIHPWALELAYIRVRSEKPQGISPVPLISFSITLLYSKCLAHFRDFWNHAFYNFITRLFAALSIRVILSPSWCLNFQSTQLYSFIFFSCWRAMGIFDFSRQCRHSSHHRFADES